MENEIVSMVCENITYYTESTMFFMTMVAVLAIFLFICWCWGLYVSEKYLSYRKFVNQKSLTQDYQNWVDERKRG